VIASEKKSEELLEYYQVIENVCLKFVEFRMLQRLVLQLYKLYSSSFSLFLILGFSRMHSWNNW